MKGARDGWTWFGLAVVGGAAAILSFSALADLARRCDITGRIDLYLVEFQLAWLLPLAVDVFAVTATRIWLRRKASAEAIAYAQRAAWAAIGATVVGNAYHGFLTGAGRIDVVIVSAIPALALGALVHLAVLVGRDHAGSTDEHPTVDPWADLLDDVLAELWAAAIKAWAEPVDPAARPIPDRSEPDEVLATDLRAEDAARRAKDLPPLPRDGIRDRYRVGGTRAARLRDLADAPTRADVSQIVPDQHPINGQPGRLDEPVPVGGRTRDGGWTA